MDSMGNVSAWWDVAKYVGAGGAFVLGIVCWKIWQAYQEEVKYSKQRDRETLTVLAEMVKEDAALATKLDHNKDQVLSAVADLKSTVLRHMEK